MIDKVPGSLAVAPIPMMTRPAISQSTLLAIAATTEPAQNTATPMSMMRLRPKMSPSIPATSMKLANVSAYPLTTHCREVTPVCRSLWTLARPTLTTVLSRNVRNRTPHKVASARAWAADPSPPSLMSNPGGAPSVPGEPSAPWVSSVGLARAIGTRPSRFRGSCARVLLYHGAGSGILDGVPPGEDSGLPTLQRYTPRACSWTRSARQRLLEDRRWISVLQIKHPSHERLCRRSDPFSST